MRFPCRSHRRRSSWRLVMRGCLLLVIFCGSLRAQEMRRADAEGNLLPAHAVARMGSPSLLSGRPINALAFSRDGKLLVSAARDGTVLVWDMPAGGLRHQFDYYSPTAVA